MGEKLIKLDFGTFSLEAELFDTKIANKFAEGLPYEVQLTQWGGELYGSIGKDLGEENPVATIPSGGLAYTRKGNYLCVFYGQTPAWEVEYIGQIPDGKWQALENYSNLDSVIVKRIEESR